MQFSSALMANIKPSATDAMSKRARQLRVSGRDVVDLSIGAPHISPPKEFLAAIEKALRDGPHSYTEVAGIPALRTIVAERIRERTGLAFGPEHVIVSNGAKQVIFNALAATLNAGDEVVLAAPYWTSYPDMVRLAGGVPRPVLGHAHNRFILDGDGLRSAMGPRTRWVILNSPSNPTGAVMTAEELREIADCLEDRPDVLVLVDEIYGSITFDGRSAARFLNVAPHFRERTLVVDGLSKAFAAPGWRIGYGVGPRDLISLMATYQSQTTSNAGAAAQAGATAVLRNVEGVEASCRRVYEPLRDLVASHLGRIQGVRISPMEGAFYAFIDMRAFIADGGVASDTLALTERLLDEVGVAVLPGEAFGCPGHVRLSYAAPPATLEAGLDRIASLLSSAHPVLNAPEISRKRQPLDERA